MDSDDIGLQNIVDIWLDSLTLEELIAFREKLRGMMPARVADYKEE